MPFPLRLLIHIFLNAGLLWILEHHLGNHVVVFGGRNAYLAIGLLITLLNLFLRPILNLITLPLRLLFTLLAAILVNLVFLAFTYQIALRFDPNLAVLVITGGAVGWIIVSSVLGLGNWGMKMVL